MRPLADPVNSGVIMEKQMVSSREQIAHTDEREIMDSVSYLISLGVLTDWKAYYRLVKTAGFPPGVLIGPRTRRIRRGDWKAWLASRPTGKAA